MLLNGTVAAGFLPCCHPSSSARGKAKGSRPEAGFTLIELLVVIAIIAILAAILFPRFRPSP